MKAAKKVVENIIENELTIIDFFSLLKPRVMTLVVFTAIAGMYLAPNNINPIIALIATICIALGSGSAGVINMWYEHETDALMNRTKMRAIPVGKILPHNALEFGIVLALFSVIVMFIATNLTAAFLLLVAILFYVFVYTIWLKPITPYNIVIGGAAGSFPPMIGWAAVTGDISVESIISFLLIFMWTPPHFWALASYKNEEYAKVGIPMLPVVRGIDETCKQIFLYTIGLVIVSFLPFAFNMSGFIYALGSTILGILFFNYSYDLYSQYNEKKARKIFKFSLLYLFLIFVLLMVDKLFLILGNE